MMTTSDTQRLQTGAHLTAVLWTPESGWADTEDRLRLAAGITAEEKLARLTEALLDLPTLAERVVELANHVAAILECTDQMLNESDPEQTIEIFDGFQDTRIDSQTEHGHVAKEKVHDNADAPLRH
jgi:hypothetical protein